MRCERIVAATFVSLDGMMQALGGSHQDPSAFGAQVSTSA